MLFEKYRPQLFKELVGRNSQVAQVKAMMERPDGIPHLFLYGPPGTGKTTFGKVVVNELFPEGKSANFFEFNASSDRGIEFIRNTIADIAKRRPFGQAFKVIMMDEADYITPDAQACFRRILEEFSHDTRFIFTANYPYKLIPALLSRFVSIEFPVIDIKSIAMRLKYICKKEGLEKTDAELIAMGKACNGDLRKAINLLEGGNSDSAVESMFDSLTISAIAKLSKTERIMMAFAGDPDHIFAKLMELVEKEKAWDKIEMMANCNYKMNMSVHKTLFLAHLLDKSFG